MVRVAVVPGGGFPCRSARVVWNAAPCPATSAMVTTPAAYFQQAALQLAGVSQAPAIPYSPYTVPAAPAIVYAVPAAPAVAYAVPAAPAIVWSSTIFFGPPRAINPKRPAPAAPTAAPPAKSIKPYSSPYAVFCQEQRPFLPRNLRNSVREQTLGQLWRRLSKHEQAMYKVGGSELPAPASAPEVVPAPAPAPAPVAAPALKPYFFPALKAFVPAPAPSPTASMALNPLATTGLELLSTAALSAA